MALIHQMTEDGDVQGECCCGGEEPCPDGCSGCCGKYTVTLSVTNPDTKCDEFMGDVDCDTWDGDWDFVQDGDTCVWNLSGGEGDLRCDGSTWTMEFSSVFWAGCTITFTAPNVDDCPPDQPSDWTQDGGETCQATITGITKSDCP